MSYIICAEVPVNVHRPDGLKPTSREIHPTKAEAVRVMCGFENPSLMRSRSHPYYVKGGVTLRVIDADCDLGRRLCRTQMPF